MTIRGRGRGRWNSGLPTIIRDPIEIAVDKIAHHPDPKQAGADVSRAVDRARDLAAREDVPDEVRQHLALTADYLNYYQVLLMKASRTVFRALLVMALLLVLVIVMIVHNNPA